MASAYPAGLDTFATNKANATVTATDHPTHHNDLADAVNKIEAELGTNPSGASATVAARFSGVGTLQLLGGDPTTGTVTFTTGSNDRHCRRITCPSPGVILAVGAWLKPLVDNVPGSPYIGILTEGGDEPGQMFAQSSAVVTQYLLNTTTDVARMFYWPIVAPILVAGDYWIEFLLLHVNGIELGIKVNQGAADTVGTKGAGGNWLTEEGSSSSTFTETDDEVILQALFQSATYL